ncbi:hypothetical protein LINPERPRIM_LOCUS1267 [Linum perenne]
MENYRSKSCRDGRFPVEFGYETAPRNMKDLRSYSVSCGAGQHNEEKGEKQGKGHVEVVGSRSWGLNFDPELRRKKRVVSYKAYSMEGKMKGSFRKSFRWVKDTCNQVVYGWK